jgi:hypothetical protein
MDVQATAKAGVCTQAHVQPDRGGEGTRTEQDGVELGGALVDVGQEDAAGLEHRHKLRHAGRRQRRQKWVVCLAHLQLQHRPIGHLRRRLLRCIKFTIDIDLAVNEASTHG